MKQYLDAINIMLQTIGEQPLNSDTELADSFEGTTASSVLDEVKLEVLSYGYHCNTDYNWKFTPDTNGYIAIPLNVMSVDPTNKNTDYILKDHKLYDRKNQTFKFSAPVNCDVTWDITFDNIPPVLQYYITIRAARKFQGRVIGDTTQYSFTQQDEADAKAEVMRYESDTGDYSIFDSYSSFRVIDRRFNPISIGG